jgi:ribosome maturation factor RimP
VVRHSLLIDKERMELKTIETLIQPIVEQHQLILVETKWTTEGSMRILQVAIMDQEGNMDIDTCAKISAELSPILDESSLKDQRYFLEVCSPGAERVLKDDTDIQRCVGGNVRIYLKQPIDKSLEWEGALLAYDGHQGQLEVNVKTRKKIITFEKDQLNKIRLAVKL